MSAQPDGETDGKYSLPPMPDSEDSEEESSREEPPAASWSDLSIIERVGLNSVEMSEKDIETAFSQIALAFRSDQYTLKQRLQAEEHARNLAEENVQLELTRGRETLELLKGLCLDSKRSKILQKLELSLDILGGTVERISNTAEVLGAVHQEARVSRAVELMVAHVESLKRRYDRNAAELEEAKKTLQQQNTSRSLDHRISPDQEENEMKMKASQSNLRRRVSISLIPFLSQEKKKQETKKPVSPMKKSLSFCPSHSSESGWSAVTRDDGNSADDRPADPGEPPPPPPPEAPAAPPERPPTPEPECPPPKAAAATKTATRSSSLDTLRQRHRGKAALSRRKDRKAANLDKRISGSPCAALRRPRLLTHWMYRCRWTLLCTYLVALFCVLSMTFFLWKLQDGASEP